MTTEQNNGACSPSFSSAGLDVTVAMMTNAELADAILYAFDRCDQRYSGGYTTGNTEHGKAMVEHLKELLAIQCTRAGMVKTSNTGNDPRSRVD